MILKDTVIKMLVDADLDLCKVRTVGRDNPNVMKAFNNQFNDEVKKHGNPHVIQSPYTLYRQSLRGCWVLS